MGIKTILQLVLAKADVVEIDGHQVDPYHNRLGLPLGPPKGDVVCFTTRKGSAVVFDPAQEVEVTDGVCSFADSTGAKHQLDAYLLRQMTDEDFLAPPTAE